MPCFLKQVEFLGHLVTVESISVQPGNISAVKDWPQPQSVTELWQFLGLCNYHRRFILGYASIAAPLTNLLRGKPSSIQFNIAQIQAFQDLKNCLVLAPVFKVYDPELPIRVQSDASKPAVGAISKYQYGSNQHLVECFFKRLNDAESYYCAAEREILGCIFALQCWRLFLIGKQFDVLTNHAPNKYIFTQQKLSHRWIRWVEVLSEYAANFIYKPGRVHSTPVALSRILTSNAVSKPQPLLEAVLQAYIASIYQEFQGFKSKVLNPTSEFQVGQGLIVLLVQDSFPIVIPGDANQLKQNILTELHTSPLGGHLGHHKHLELIRTHFWWLNLISQVQEFFRLCVLCQQTKAVSQKPLGLLQLLEPLSRPFEQVMIDLITHLPSSFGHDAVFTIVDRYSKYIIFLPCSTTSTAVDLASLFYDHIVSKFGMPVKIVSDRDSRFLSNFWQSNKNAVMQGGLIFRMPPLD